ncbi:MAG TPA: hypothetical protein VMM18_02600 [Gemmatimonadaceae bacterium]|nr:hypothetical protein [Gemmatimonadaceae bacterium]
MHASQSSATERYHSLLTDDIAAESQAQLDDQLRLRGLQFGDRPLCTVLRPRWMSAERYRFLQVTGALILRAFRRAHDAALADPALLGQFGLTDWERELVRDDPGFRDSSPLSRLDAFFGDDGQLKFTEYNAETPAGSAYNDVLSEVFYGLPVMREFLREWDARPLPARHNVLHGLLDAYRQWSGSNRLPRIAIVDWSDVPTRSEFLLFQDYFRRQGVGCVLADPRTMEYRAGVLLAEGGPVDLIYKRVLISELIADGGLDQPLVRAVRARAACMVNPFRCKILHKKSSLAVLGDERNAHLFSPEEQRAIEAHIPWTRVVEERRTLHEETKVDLVPWIAEHRERLVLKPHDEYGGKGIVLGWEVSDELWRDTLAIALREPYIVQERVPLPSEPYPSLVDGKVVIADRMLDTAPYVAYGRYVDGCLTRLSTAALLNVTAGGGSTVPTFVVERR